MTTAPSLYPHLSPTQQKVRRRLIEDIGELPVLPMVLSRLAALNPSQDDYFDQVTKLISQDPNLAARLLVVANSGANRGAAQIRTIQDAVVRLGARGVSNLVISMGMVQVFVPKKPFEKALWLHALEVGNVGRAIARALKDRSMHPEELYLAGLLHDIGRFILFHEATEGLQGTSEGEWDSPEALLENEVSLCGVDHAELGGRACQKWGLPLELSLVVRHHHASEVHGEELNEERFKLIEIVQAADRIMFMAQAPVGPGLHKMGDEQLSSLVVESLPFWVTLDPWSLLPALREATEAAHRSAEAMGIRA